MVSPYLGFCLGFRVQGLGFRVYRGLRGLGLLRVWGSRVLGFLGFGDRAVGFRVEAS